jgi:hypothetical protein
MPTLEEAERCPKCSIPGMAGAKNPVPPSQIGRRGVSVIVYTCKNERCNWYDTGWTVQVNEDGSIPERKAEGPKQFEAYTPGQEARARQDIEEAKMLDPSITDIKHRPGVEPG